MACPAAGASSTMRSLAARSSCLTLPSTRMSWMPGAAVATTSMAPRRRQPLRAIRAEAVVRQVPRRRRAPADHLARRSALPEQLRADATDLPSISTTSARQPGAAPLRASAAVTVVLPTPPFPATMTTRDGRRTRRIHLESLRRCTLRRLADRRAAWLPACSPSLSALRRRRRRVGRRLRAGRRRPGVRLDRCPSCVDCRRPARSTDAERGGRRGARPPARQPRRGGRRRRDRRPRASASRRPTSRSRSGSARPVLGTYGAGQLRAAADVRRPAPEAGCGPRGPQLRSVEAVDRGAADSRSTARQVSDAAATAHASGLADAAPTWRHGRRLDGPWDGDDRGRPRSSAAAAARVTPATPLRRPASGRPAAHTVASPPVAYLLFVIGLVLLLFEFFTAGVGVAGLVGAVFLVLGGYGLAVLPTSPWPSACSSPAIARLRRRRADRRAPGLDRHRHVLLRRRVAVRLYDDGVSLSWITLLVAIVGMVLAMLGGMPAMVRSRFSTPTIGREWMVGEEGTPAAPVAPEGVVVRGAPWRARTNRATPIAEGDAVRVSAIDGARPRGRTAPGRRPATTASVPLTEVSLVAS